MIKREVWIHKFGVYKVDLYKTQNYLSPISATIGMSGGGGREGFNNKTSKITEISVK